MEKIKKAKKVKTKKIHSKSLNSILLYSTEGTKSGEIDVPSEIFDVTASDKLLAQYVRVYLANQRMAGRMGSNTTTVKNLKVFEVNDEKLIVQGLIPGTRGGLVMIQPVIH